MIQMVVSHCDTDHIKRRGLIKEAIGIDLKGCRSGYERLQGSSVRYCRTDQNTRGWKKDIFDKGHI